MGAKKALAHRVSFVDFIDRLAHLRLRIRNAPPDDVSTYVAAYLEQAQALCEASDLHSPALQSFVDDLVRTEVARRSQAQIVPADFLEKIAELELALIEAKNVARSGHRAVQEQIAAADEDFEVMRAFLSERRRRSGHRY